MAKEFKDYDKLYAKLEGTALKRIIDAGDLDEVDRAQLEKDIAAIQNGDPKQLFGFPYYSKYKSTEISLAVYTGQSAPDWQEFRVSLKKLSTREKLFCLTFYWDMHRGRAPNTLHIIRLNNYIGALIRGGQLSNDGKFTIKD